MKREITEGGGQGERETGYMYDDEQNEGAGRREAWSVGSTHKVKTTGTKGKTINGQEEGNTNDNEKRGTKRTWNGATDHVLVELDIACRDADGTKSKCVLCERAGHSGPERVPRARADGESRTANVMQSDLRRQGLEVRGEVRCRVSGRREYGGERTGEGTGVNIVKLELNRK
jgi:hypothetical protein